MMICCWQLNIVINIYVIFVFREHAGIGASRVRYQPLYEGNA